MKILLILLTLLTSVHAEGFSHFKKENLKQLVSGYSFTEGPTFDGKNIYFTAPRDKKIVKWSIEKQKASTFYEGENSPGALYFHNSFLFATKNGIMKTPLNSAKLTQYVEKYNGKLFNNTNDLWASPKGFVYFTDPNYGRKPLKQEGEFAYYVNLKGEVKRINATFKRPNGIIGSKDGKKLFITDAGASKTYVFELDENGNPSEQVLFTDIGGDGMTLDSKGNLYIAVPRQKSLVVINPQGKEIARIKDFGCTNVCFGGKDMKTLFITSGGLHSIQMPFKGQ